MDNFTVTQCLPLLLCVFAWVQLNQMHISFDCTVPFKRFMHIKRIPIHTSLIGICSWSQLVWLSFSSYFLTNDPMFFIGLHLWSINAMIFEPLYHFAPGNSALLWWEKHRSLPNGAWIVLGWSFVFLGTTVRKPTPQDEKQSNMDTLLSPCSKA